MTRSVLKGILSLSLLSANAIYAQTQAALSGSVTDASGGVVVGATVSARNVETGVAYPAHTGSTGNYAIPTLPPGKYEISCESSGFKRALQTGISLETGFSSTIDFRLELGALSDTVSVTATAPLLQSESSSVGQFIERATVENMPVQSRRSGSLVRLMGGVVFNNETGPEQIPQFSMAGGRSANQMWALDGAVTQNVALGTPQVEMNPPSESLQEFRAEANNYSAEFGRSGNGLILMTTRSGTNMFHGAGYEFFRNSNMDARTFFARDVAPLRYNIFGSSFSGPIKHDRTFFFLNYEGARQRNGTTISNTIVPHPAEVNGDFSRRANFRLLDPQTNQPFPGNTIPANRIDPVGQALARLYPAPNQPDDPTKTPAANYITNVSDSLTQDYGTAKVDHSFSDRDRAFGRLSIFWAPQTTASVYPNPVVDYRGFNSNVDHTQILGSWFHSFKPTLINEARYSWGNRHFARYSFGATSGLNEKLGIKGVDQQKFATVTVAGLSGLGTTPQTRIQSPILTHQFVDTLTWIRGSHTIKTGIEYRYSENGDDFQQTAGGTFAFSNRATGDALAALLLGHVDSAARVSTDFLNSRTDYWGAFVQDDFKVTSKLTLNFGLRWEMDTPRWDKNNRQSGFDQRAINPVSGTPGVVTFAGLNGVSKYAHHFDSNNFGPRFGFAYRLGSSMVVRGGYGISYNPEYVAATANPLSNGYGINGNFTSPDGGFTPAIVLRNGLPAITREPLDPAFGAVKVGQATRLAPDFFQQNHRNGYAQQWNFTVQRELKSNLSAEAAYIANVGHHLAGPDVNINLIPLTNGHGPARQDQTARLYPQFGNVSLKSPPWGNSTYHALNLKLEKRYSGGLNFTMNYTWSKFLDDVQGNAEPNGGSGGGGYTHVELRRLDKSFSGNDVAHRFIASAVYDLPFGATRTWRIGNPVLRGIAGDWGMGLITELRSGLPWGVTEQTNTTNTFSAAQRPNLIRNPLLGDFASRDAMLNQYFDTTAFVVPATGVFGNAARNVGHGPGIIGVDASMHKQFPITERIKFQLRGDFYNLLNRPAFANPNTVQGRGDFGKITSTLASSTGRLIQVSARLEF